VAEKKEFRMKKFIRAAQTNYDRVVVEYAEKFKNQCLNFVDGF